MDIAYKTCRHMAVVLMLVLFVSACSSGLSKEECLLADWRQIGFEDGSQGRDLAMIASHRKSCAKAGVAPDLDRYELGHKKGVVSWCVYDKGLAHGSRGKSYNGICPSSLEANFLAGFNLGQKRYTAMTKVHSLEQSVRLSEDVIYNLEHEKEVLGAIIISNESSQEQRYQAMNRKDEIPALIEQAKTQYNRDNRALQRAINERRALD